MNQDNIYVTSPFLPPLNEYISYLECIWDSKILTNGGPFHKELELKLSELLDVPYVSLFCNGTIALLASLDGLESGSEVITTPFSFVATSNAIIRSGLVPVFVDVDPITSNICPQAVVDAITPRTKAVLAVHCYGYPCDTDSLSQICKDNNIKLIYDAAHAFGTIHNNRSLCSYGDISAVSFHATKVFNTFEGGAVITHGSAEKLRVDRFRNFGIVDEISADLIGLNGKLSEVNSAMGLLQLKYLEKIIGKRQAIGKEYSKRLVKIEGINILRPNNIDNDNYSYYPIRVTSNYPMSRDALCEMLRSNGIYARRYFYPLIPSLESYTSYRDSLKTLPHSISLADSILCLPIYPDLSIDNVIQIADLIASPL